MAACDSYLDDLLARGRAYFSPDEPLAAIDVAPMLPAGVRWTDVDAIHDAFERVWTELLARIDGEAWKLTGAAIEELRAIRYPGLLIPRVRGRLQ